MRSDSAPLPFPLYDYEYDYDLLLRALLPLHRLLPRPLHYSLRSTRFSSRSSPFSARLTLRSVAHMLCWRRCGRPLQRELTVTVTSLRYLLKAHRGR